MTTAAPRVARSRQRNVPAGAETIPKRGQTLKTGDAVRIVYEGRTVRGSVKLASPNGRSLILEFEAILGGFAGMMPALMDDHGIYRDLIFGRHVGVAPIEEESQ